MRRASPNSSERPPPIEPSSILRLSSPLCPRKGFEFIHTFSPPLSRFSDATEEKGVVGVSLSWRISPPKKPSALFLFSGDRVADAGSPTTAPFRSFHFLAGTASFVYGFFSLIESISFFPRMHFRTVDSFSNDSPVSSVTIFFPLFFKEVVDFPPLNCGQNWLGVVRHDRRLFPDWS